MLVIRSIVILSTLFITLIASASEQHDVRIVVTGNLMGAIRECKCPTGQPGGLARRKTVFDNIRQETPEAIFIECGRLMNDKMDEEEIEILKILLNVIDYDIVNCYLIDYYRATPVRLSHRDMFYRPGVKKMTRRLSSNYTHLQKCAINFPFKSDPQQEKQSTWTEELSDKWLLSRKCRFEFKPDINANVVMITRTANYEYVRVDTLIRKRFAVENPYDLSASNGKNEITPSDFPTDALSVLVRNMVFGDDPSQDENEVPTELHGTENLRYLDIVILGNDGHIEPDIEKSPLRNYYPENLKVPEKDILIVRPGLYGEYVIVIDVRDEEFVISSFEWEAIPTRSVVPDSTMQSFINEFYPSPWIEELDR